MSNLLLNIGPQASAALPVAGARVGEANGALFAGGPALTLIDASVDTALRFGEMLRELQLPMTAEPAQIEVAAQASTDEIKEEAATEEPPSLHYSVAPEVLAQTPVQPTAPVQPTITSTFDGSDAGARPVAANLQLAQTAVSLSTSAASQASAPDMLVLQITAPQVAAPTVTVPVFNPATATPESVSTASEKLPVQLSSSHSISNPTASLAAFVGDSVTTTLIDRPVAPARQSLEALLGERLQTQIAKRSEHATVRLDPPSMGTIEISVRHEAGQLHVQLRASNSEVARQLQAIGETLRQDLVQRQHETVSVHVADSSREGDRQRQRAQFAWQEEPGRALNESRDEYDSFAMHAPSE